MTEIKLPQYQCHKKVRAAKITGFRQNGKRDMPDLLLGEIGGIVTMLPDWHEKHKPQVGGYYVVYEDGYMSYSPAEAFESGYSLEVETKTYADCTIATGVAPLPDQSPIEQAIQAAGANVAPRITPDDIEAAIASEHYFTGWDGRVGVLARAAPADLRCGEIFVLSREKEPVLLDHVTFCVLILKNGTKVVGVNEGPVSPANFNAETGRQYARQKAIDQIWPMLGYELRTKLAGA